MGRERDDEKFDWVGMIFDFVIGGGIGAALGGYIWFQSYGDTPLTSSQAYQLIGALAIAGAIIAWLNRNNYKDIDWADRISNYHDAQFMLVMLFCGFFLTGLFVYSMFFP